MAGQAELFGNQCADGASAQPRLFVAILDVLGSHAGGMLADSGFAGLGGFFQRLLHPGGCVGFGLVGQYQWNF